MGIKRVGRARNKLRVDRITHGGLSFEGIPFFVKGSSLHPFERLIVGFKEGCGGVGVVQSWELLPWRAQCVRQLLPSQSHPETADKKNGERPEREETL